MSFAKAVAFVLDREGGLVDDPNDPGGLTNLGIALNRHPELTAEDIRTMSRSRAANIYFDQYWTPVQGAQWPSGVDLVMLDICVNMGPETATQCLQKALGIDVDGKIGPQTIRAAQAAKIPTLIAKLTSARINHYASLPGWAHDGHGWTARAVEAAIEGVMP